MERVAFDKTGTLTEGTPRVIAADDEALALACALEVGDRHPVARAIVAEVERRRLPFPRATVVRGELVMKDEEQAGEFRGRDVVARDR